MQRTKWLAAPLAFAAVMAFGQTPKPAPKGDAAKGKEAFDQNCGLCHNAASTEALMGPGLKGLFRMAKLPNTGKPVTDENVMAQINNGGNGMPPYKDVLTETDKVNILAYLKTI